MITGRRIGIGLGVLPDGVQDLRHKYQLLVPQDTKPKVDVLRRLDGLVKQTGPCKMTSVNQRTAGVVLQPQHRKEGPA